MRTAPFLRSLFLATTALWTTTTATAGESSSSSSSSTSSSSSASRGLVVTIPASALIPHPHALPATTHATLAKLSAISPTGEREREPPQASLKTAYISPDNKFVFRDVADGISSPSTVATTAATASYLLTIYSRDYTFMNYRVDVDVSGGSSDGGVIGVWGVMRGFKWDFRSSTTNRVLSTGTGPGSTHGADGADDSVNGDDFVLEAMPLAKRSFYEEPASFSLISLLRSPMVLLGIFGAVVTIFLPKVLENMDPEMREQLNNPSAQLSQLSQPGGGGGGPAPPKGKSASGGSADSSTTSAVAASAAADANSIAGSFDFASYMASRSAAASAASGRDEGNGGGGGGESRRRGAKKR